MIRFLFFLSLFFHSTCAKKSPNVQPPKWQTLTGEEPLVIAKGGLSGLFPESSQYAVQVAMSNSLDTMVLYCNLQLSKDGDGFCISTLRLDKTTNAPELFPKHKKTYNVDGEDQDGWFPIDFTTNEMLNNLSYVQSVQTRPALFDNTLPISTVEDSTGQKPAKFWLNVQYDMFYNQHKISVASFLRRFLGRNGVDYISSPEVNFLKSLSTTLDKKKTKLVFRFERADMIEPTTKKSYGSLLKPLASIKAFASGILVPKEYIWPINAAKYLEAATSLVEDAHKEGLEVYAYGFANDLPPSYNYSYSPEAEYLQFIDNSKFSVDGVLSDFPPTASAAIGCLAHSKDSKIGRKDLLVISSNGASGVYAASTDLAYQQAVDDGADIIDCSVQMSKDGVPFCSSSANLMGDTNVVTTFMDRSTQIPQIDSQSGIYSFDLTWSEIETLKPQLQSSLPKDLSMPRNPAYKNKGKFMTLQDFLAFAKQKAVTGILINIENAAYLASEKALSITDAVSSALSNATLGKQQVLIKSDDSSVLSKFKDVPTYKRVFNIENAVRSAPKQSVQEISKFANAVSVTRNSLIEYTPDFFTSAKTNIVKEMHAANLSVYVGVLRNEFTTIAPDIFSDPMIEIATYRVGLQVDGIITEYPATAVSYLRSPCSDMHAADAQYTILPVEPGALRQFVPAQAQSPAAAPLPSLEAADVVDPPLPPLSKSSTPQNASTPAPGAPSKSSAQAARVRPYLVAATLLCLYSLQVLPWYGD